MTKIRTNMCPNCSEDLTDAYSAIDDRIEDGFICPFCKATLAYKRIYPTIALVFLVLNFICAFLIVTCLLFKKECSSFSNYLYVMFPLFILLTIGTLRIKNSYVIKTPNKSSNLTGAENAPPS